MQALNRFGQLPPKDFMLLGIEDVAYVKHVANDGRTSYLIHAADGTAMGQSAERDLAFAAIRQHGLEPLSVH